MPLVTCPDCKNEVSDAAEACPKCGRPMRPSSATKKSSSASGCLVLFVLLIGSCVAVSLLGDDDKKGSQAQRTYRGQRKTYRLPSSGVIRRIGGYEASHTFPAFSTYVVSRTDIVCHFHQGTPVRLLKGHGHGIGLMLLVKSPKCEGWVTEHIVDPF